MAALFFDTSALVKRYDRAEAGSESVRSLCRRSSGHIIFLSRATPVEVASAFSRKRREGVFSQQRRDQAWRLFQTHSRKEYRIIAAEEAVWRQAEALPFLYPLTAYDALQLASAQRAATLIATLAAEFRFCTADRVQARAAQQEGLVVEFIA